MLVLVASCDDDKEPRYHGGTPVFLCGDIWSADKDTLTCRDATTNYDALTKFARLKELTLRHVRLIGDDRKRPLTRLDLLDLEDVSIPEWFIKKVPNIQWLWLTNMEFQLSWVRYLPALEDVRFFRMPVRDLRPLAGLRNLKKVYLVAVPDASKAAAELERLRPDIDIDIVAPVAGAP